MRRPNRTLSIFNLSALDVLANAVGTFVLLVVIFMPYFRMTHSARSEIPAMRFAAQDQQSETEEQRTRAAALLAAADAAEAEAEAKERAAAELLRAARQHRADAEATSQKAGAEERAAAELLASVDRRVVQQMDLVFIIDASGSMAQTIRDLGQSLAGIVRVLERLVPSLRVGFVAYRDYDVGSWVVRDLPLTPTSNRLADVLRFAESLEPARVGGQSVTEAVHAGLERAATMGYRPGARTRLIVVGDAAAHPHERQATLALARSFALAAPNRSVSTLFVTTQSYLRFGRGDREFFAELARAGGGLFSDHRGEMMESVLLSVLEK
jgi:Mg-chelatase subunit ChlD